MSIPNDGQWHHLEVTSSDGEMSVYLDGEKISEHSVPEGVWLRALWKRGGEDEVDLVIPWVDDLPEPGTTEFIDNPNEDDSDG